MVIDNNVVNYETLKSKLAESFNKLKGISEHDLPITVILKEDHVAIFHSNTTNDFSIVHGDGQVRKFNLKDDWETLVAGFPDLIYVLGSPHLWILALSNLRWVMGDVNTKSLT